MGLTIIEAKVIIELSLETYLPIVCGQNKSISEVLFKCALLDNFMLIDLNHFDIGSNYFKNKRLL